ncbi:MAG: hypothetical protein IJN77_07495 [Oscillospiraceae bacterium]|nr:hypothetical protein [Oscillospiraceae bacterium]
MADNMKIYYPAVDGAITQIEQIAQRYATVAENFKNEFDTATKGWTGESKNAMKNYIDVAVYNYIAEDMKKTVLALVTLLENNQQQINSADSKIAESLPKQIG